MTDLRTFDGQPTGPHHSHVGYPPDASDALRRIRSGLPTYWPTDPTTIDQAAYRAFSETRGKNDD